jgi:hypothetical protein
MCPPELLDLLHQHLGKISSLSFALSMFGPDIMYEEFSLRCGYNDRFLDPAVIFLDLNK